MEGTGKMMVHTSGGRLGNMTVPPTQASTQEEIFQSFDYETMNMAMHQSQKTTQGTTTLQMEIGSILNWKAGLMTMHTKFAFPNQKDQEQCKTIKLPFFLRFLPIGKITRKIKDMETSFFKCVGHHDDLDNFALKVEFPPKWIPRKLLPKTADISLALDVDVDANGLMKSMKMSEGTSMDIHMNVNGKMETMHSETQVLQDLVVNKSRAGGPTEKDLQVPAAWGDCSTIHMPELEDLLAEWERPDSPFVGHTRIIPHTLRAMLAESKSSAVIV
jgi:hypothetical protein